MDLSCEPPYPVGGGADLVNDLVQQLGCVGGLDGKESPKQLEANRDGREVLLHAVVQGPLDPSLLGVMGGDQTRARLV